MRVRKKPVEVEAIQWRQNEMLVYQVLKWMGGLENGNASLIGKDADGLYIDTLEGRMHVSDGDWIIRGVKGELYPCKPDIFAETYEILEG